MSSRLIILPVHSPRGNERTIVFLFQAKFHVYRLLSLIEIEEKVHRNFDTQVEQPDPETAGSR